MAANKLLLHDLLRQDQEPFILNSYISDKQYQLKQQQKVHRPINNHVLLRKKNQTPVLPKPNLSITQICKNTCFFSFRDSPDYKKSPLFQFYSPMNKSAAGGSHKSSNPVFLHIPARTAAVLQEAASRIQKHSSHSKITRKNHQNNNKSSNSGLFSSILKKLTTKNRAHKHNNNVSLRWESEKVKEKLTVLVDKKCDVGFCSCSCNCSLRSSVFWSESNEGRFLDNETSSSSCNCDDFDESLMFESDEKRENGVDFVVDPCYQNNGGFCKSPFHFVLDSSLEEEGECGTPDFSSSPVTSPIHIITEEKRAAKFQVEEIETEDEEKEQFSPLSVLDPLFDIDEDGQDDDNDDDCKDENSFNIECSYAFVQKAKQQLLHKLRRFEQLAELDPIELEKRILEDEQEQEYHRESCDGSSNAAQKDMKKLVADLIAEEAQKRPETTFCDDREEIAKRVFKRLETLKNAESTNTIDMMVELDFKAEEVKGWKMNHNINKYDEEQVKMIVMEIEVAIFGLMLQELSEDLLDC